MKTPDNSLPPLLNAVRLSLGDVAGAVGVSRNAADLWRAGLNRPGPATRKRLLRFVRQHATNLLVLADAVQKEGERRGKKRGSSKRPDRLLHR